MSRRTRRPRDQQGFTLVEMVVTTAILAIVIAILAPLVTSALTTFTRQSDRTGAIDQMNLVLQQLEHDVSASSTLNVASASDLQLIAVLPSTTHDTASCIEYKLTTATVPAPLALQRRTRVAGTGIAWPSTWQTLLTPIKLSGQAAGSVIPNPAGASPFTSGGNGRSVNIDLQVQNGGSPILEEKTTATGSTVIAGISGTTAWTASCS
jgi:prepilin-type N-terminal cleavage/methylation domain-containing protein